MKKCTKCERIKELLEFSKDSNSKDKLCYRCKECVNISSRKSYKNKNGLITRIYISQKSTSKTRGHIPPIYSKQQLSEWLLSQELFHKLFKEWADVNYETTRRPSIDRLDDNKGYSFSNIRLVTWGENMAKAHAYQRIGKQNASIPIKAVVQFTKDRVFIREFISTQEASRQTRVNQGNLSQCCTGKRNYAGGFIWKFKTMV